MFKSLKEKMLKKMHPYPISPSGFIPSYFFIKNSKNKKKVLIIGDYSKKDYTIMNHYNKDTYLIDIIEIKNTKNFFQQSITEKTSFKNQTFDIVVLAEVIEHLFEDKKALDEINRILKNDGLFFISLPYFNDIPTYHVRMHSPKTIRRLLKECGFAVKDSIKRGFISHLSNIYLKYLIYAPILFLDKLSYIKLHYNIELFISNNIPKFHSIFRAYGEAMICKKTKNVNFNELQKKTFSNR